MKGRALAAALLLLSVPASAETNEAAATELFDTGRDLMKAGRFAEACPKLAASLRLDAKVGTLARLAECEEHVGQMASAHAHWARALSLAETAHDARRAIIKVEFDRIDQLVPKLVIDLPPAAPPSVTLDIDGIDVGDASFGVPLPVELGKHTVEVRAEGKKTWTTHVETTTKGTIQRVAVPGLEDAPPPLPPVILAPLATPLRTPGIVIGSAGAVTMVAGVLVAVLVAKKDANDSNAEGCAGAVCTTMNGQSERTDAVEAGDTATGVFVAGAVLTAAGLTLALLPARRWGQRSSTALLASLHAGAGPGSVTFGGSF